MSNVWGGRFKEEMNEEVQSFNQSISVDYRLFHEDIKGSIAHITMLIKQGVLTEKEGHTMIEGLQEIERDYRAGKINFKEEYEDIHMNIEQLLTNKIGVLGGKMHTGRSRNDQVATDMHLYAKKCVHELSEAVEQLQQTLVVTAKKYIDVLMPGYTHLQRAQPILFSHHIMSYFWMLQRDKERLNDSLKRIDISPLGSGALAGTTYPIDQSYSAEILGFPAVYHNSMDAVSDRDYLIETMNNMNMIMIHLSRFSEEIILWCSEEFKFVSLSDQFSTGSSIMPQKKNPDMAELIRGKSGTVCGNYIALLMTLKGLPLAYNKDLQEDKKGFFESFDSTLSSLKIFSGMIQTMTVHEKRLEETVNNDFSNATEFADYLVTLGVPFREAHKITGELVIDCIDNNRLLRDVSLEEYQQLNPLITDEIYTVLTPLNAVNRRNNENGTGTKAVRQQIAAAEQLI